MKHNYSAKTVTTKSQKGMTLIEVMVSLSIFALVVGGALALFSGASASQTTTQMKSDISAIRAAVKTLWTGQTNYGVGTDLGPILIDANKIPSTMTITGTGAARIINHAQTGTVTITGATNQYTIKLSNITSDVCAGLVVGGSNGWTSIQINTGTVLSTFPITPAIALGATACTASNANSITFTAQ